MYRVRIVGTGWSGAPSLNTIYVTSGGYTTAGALDVVTHVRAEWYGTVSYVYPTNVTQNVQGDVDQLDPATGAVVNTFSVAPPAGMPGRGAADSAPIVAAAVVRLSTGLFIAGRRLRGRMFLSPLSTASVESDGTMTSVARAYPDAFLVSLPAALTAGDAWVVWHRPKGGTGGVASEVTGGFTNDKIGELRSRRD